MALPAEFDKACVEVLAYDPEDESWDLYRSYTLELLMPINRANLTDDGARYWFVDWEAFMPAGEPDERFANKHRLRAGLGYRPSQAWRFEAVYAWTRSRNTIDEGFHSSDNIIDIRLKVKYRR